MNRELAATKNALDAARAAGWCTPEWLAFGTLPDGRAYVIEEKIADARPARSDAHDLARVLDANRLQAGRQPAVRRDWSEYQWRVLWEDAGGATLRLRQRDETAALVERILAANTRDFRLPSTDLVHGDCVLGNVLFRDDRPCFIDAEHAGKGSRAYDLATMIYVLFVGAHDRPPDAIAASCVTSSMIEFVAFGLDHWLDDVPECVVRCHAYLDRIGVT